MSWVKLVMTFISIRFTDKIPFDSQNSEEEWMSYRLAERCFFHFFVRDMAPIPTPISKWFHKTLLL